VWSNFDRRLGRRLHGFSRSQGSLGQQISTKDKIRRSVGRSTVCPIASSVRLSAALRAFFAPQSSLTFILYSLSPPTLLTTHHHPSSTLFLYFTPCAPKFAFLSLTRLSAVYPFVVRPPVILFFSSVILLSCLAAPPQIKSFISSSVRH